MNQLWLATLATAMFFIVDAQAVPVTPMTSVPPQNRALIVFLNMYTADRGWLLDRWYLNETITSARSIERNARRHYGKIIWLYRNQAQYALLRSTLLELEQDANIQTVDAIVYVHGEPERLNFVESVDSRGKPIDHFLNVSFIQEDLKSLQLTKLRALFSDACYSAFHRDEWLAVGFKVASGAIGIDNNQGRDVSLFLKSWTSGATFRQAIARANRELTYRLFDRTSRNGNSFKVWMGDAQVKIDSAP
jgi:hypothetical protein